MRCVAAFLVSIVLIVAMLFFASYMGQLVQEWADEDVVPTHGQLLLMDVGHYITLYWYAFAMVIIAVCVSIAAVVPRCKRAEDD